MATVLIGRTSAGTSGDFFANQSTAAWDFVAVASGTLGRMYWNFNGLTNGGLTTAQLGIWTNGSAVPGTRLGAATFDQGSVSGSGQISADLTSQAISIVSGTTYWLAFWGSGEIVNFQGDTAGNYAETTSGNPGGMHSGTWPASANSSTNAIIWGEAAAASSQVFVPHRMPLGV